MLGSGTARGRQRVVESYDGWIPIGLNSHQLAEGITDLRRLARERGRDPDSIEVSFFWPRPEADALKKLKDLGLTRAVLAVPAIADMDKIKARLDRYADLAQSVA